jgi:outer membrane murein-binding lipoprotein Lpp
MRKIVALAAVMPLLALGGCASSSSVEQLRQEVASVRAIAQAADQKATNAQATAQQALQEARLANEKADRIFREGLRK